MERKDLLRLAAFFRDTKKLSPRTVHNKFADVLTFLQAQGVPKLIGKNDHPRFIEQEVSIYEEEERRLCVIPTSFNLRRDAA